jgi:hypothetical protein
MLIIRILSANGLAWLERMAWVLVSVDILRQEGSDRVGHTARSKVYMTLNPLSAMMQLG